MPSDLARQGGDLKLEEKCPECDGTGVEYGSRCPNCHGKRYVPTEFGNAVNIQRLARFERSDVEVSLKLHCGVADDCGCNH